MNHDEFKAAFLFALRESRLPRVGDVVETLDLESLDRHCKISLEPLGGQGTKPFHVTAEISWVWRAANTARAITTEEDFLADVLGTEERVTSSEQPWLRVDVALRASLPWGKGLPMPAPGVWAKWAKEAIRRLDSTEPIVPEEILRESEDGRIAFLAWQGEPELRVTCGPMGQLKLEGVEIASWQAIELPRRWDDPEREPDDDPAKQLAAMMHRVRAALYAWMEALDHLL